MKLFLAAPASGLPSLLTALPSHASCLHFLTKLDFAAPASGLPSFPIALVSQDCANAEPAANAVISAARRMRFIIFLPSIGDIQFAQSAFVHGESTAKPNFLAKPLIRQDVTVFQAGEERCLSTASRHYFVDFFRLRISCSVRVALMRTSGGGKYLPSVTSLVGP